jgi:PAS domain-containing protein
LLEKQLRNQVREIAKEARLIRKEERKIQREREEFLNKEILYKTIIEAADEFIIRVEHSLEGNISFVNNTFVNLVKTVESKIYQSNLKEFFDINTVKKYGRNVSALKSGRKVRSMYSFKDSEGNVYELEVIQIPVIKNQKVQKIILTGITK